MGVELNCTSTEQIEALLEVVSRESYYSDHFESIRDEYDSIKNQLIKHVPFPTVEDAYGRVQLEESRKQSMTPATLSDRSALFTGSVQQLETGKPEQVPVALMGEKSIPQCDYCSKMYHTRENCFIIHPHLRIRGRGGRTRGSYRGVSSGRGPVRGTGSTPFNAHHIVSECESSTGAMIASELNIFRQLMSQLNTTPPTAHSAHAGSGDGQGPWQWKNDDAATLPHPETSDLEADPTTPIIETDIGNALDPTLNLPIAIRKGVRSCTNHPISNFVSYNTLSPSSLAHVTSLSSVSVPRTWQDALCDPKWKPP
ncbi:hypothetical protein AgCh_004390 [Apium graveolens]